jgi:hypothetical protein
LACPEDRRKTDTPAGRARNVPGRAEAIGEQRSDLLLASAMFDAQGSRPFADMLPIDAPTVVDDLDYQGSVDELRLELDAVLLRLTHRRPLLGGLKTVIRDVSHHVCEDRPELRESGARQADARVAHEHFYVGLSQAPSQLS